MARSAMQCEAMLKHLMVNDFFFLFHVRHNDVKKCKVGIYWQKIRCHSTLFSKRKRKWVQKINREKLTFGEFHY